MPYRILIVDDHAIVRRMLKVLVQTHPGWEVCAEAENGQEAVAKVREHKPDLVVMDLAMPVKDGITASREISAAVPGVRIVMHTLHYSPELELEAKKVGVQRVIAKVNSSDDLIRAMEELLTEGADANLAEARSLHDNPLEIPTAETEEKKPKQKSATCSEGNQRKD